MNSKFIIQIKRRYYWEDICIFNDVEEAKKYLFVLRFRNPHLRFRGVEVFYIL